jgi:toluene monooxygenase system ferredoxin subunit
MFAKACDVSELQEGKYDVTAVNRTLVLLIWPFERAAPHLSGHAPTRQ